MVKICPSCGSENVDIAEFCKGCGRRLETSENEENKKNMGIGEDLNYTLIGYGFFILTFLLFIVAFTMFNVLSSFLYFFISVVFLVFVVYATRRDLISNMHMFILLILSLFAVILSFISLFIFY